MSESIRAELISRKEMFNGIRYSEFQYSYHFNGKRFNELVFNLVIEDYGFEKVWIINRSIHTPLRDGVSYCKWNNIKLQEPQLDKFFGTFEILSNFKECIADSFDTNSLPLEKKLEMHFWVSGGFEISINIKLYREYKSSGSIEAYDWLLGNAELSDVKFLICREEIKACKNILSAHSNVFARMFSSDMLEKKTDVVEVTDVGPEIFKLLLRYVYCGQLACDGIYELMELGMAADKYEVRSLVNLCGYRLVCNLSVDNVADALVNADLVRNWLLKKDCVEFIVRNKDDVVATKGYQGMVESKRSDLLSEILCRIKLD